MCYNIQGKFETATHLYNIYAGMAELADALDSGSNGRKAVQVQVLLPAPSSLKPSIKAGLRDFLCLKTS